MKPSIWDILAIVTLLAVFALFAIYASVFANPNMALNPFPPPTDIPTLALPTATASPRALPATWTPLPNGQEGNSTLVPSATEMATSTGFVMPTFTSTATATSTRTNTPTITKTPTKTPKPTITPTRKPTKTKGPTKTPTQKPTS